MRRDIEMGSSIRGTRGEWRDLYLAAKYLLRVQVDIVRETHPRPSAPRPDVVRVLNVDPVYQFTQTEGITTN